MPKTATKRPLSPVERAVERQKMLALLGYQDRALSQGKALWNAGKGFVNEGLGSLIAGAEYAGDRSVTKEVPKDINRLGMMVAQNAGGYADAGNALWQMVKGDGKQAVPDYYRNKAGQAYQEQFNPSPADPRLERFGNFYADPAAVAFGAGRAVRGVADPKLWRGIAEDMARGGRSAVVQDGLLGKMVAPQDEALRVAQANAAKPVVDNGNIMVDGNNIGTIKLDEYDNALRVADIAISPKYQRNGYGTSVLNQIIASTNKPIVLTTDAMRGKDAQKGQRKLYESLGFVKNKNLKTSEHGIKEEYVRYPVKGEK